MRRKYYLPGFPTIVYEAGAQTFVTAHKFVKAVFQRSNVERTVQLDHLEGYTTHSRVPVDRETRDAVARTRAVKLHLAPPAPGAGPCAVHQQFPAESARSPLYGRPARLAGPV